MRCDQCKHWAEEEASVGWEAGGIGFRRCLGVRARWIIADGASKDIEYDATDDDPPEGRWANARKKALSDARAFVQDGSEYVAELVTGPDYYCALFLAREA